MINPQVKLFDDLIEIAKYDVKFIDLLRPYFLEKYSIDVHDLLFHDFNNMDTNIHSDDPIVHDSPSPNFYPSSPSTIAEEVVDSLLQIFILLLHLQLLMIIHPFMMTNGTSLIILLMIN